MTDEMKNEVTLGNIVESESVEAGELKKATMFVLLSTEELGKLHLLNRIPEIVEMYPLFGDQYNIIITTKGDINSLAKTIIRIESMKGIEVERLLESSLNNGRPVKQLVMKEIESRGDTFILEKRRRD